MPKKEEKEIKEERRYSPRAEGEKEWTKEERDAFDEVHARLRPHLNRHMREMKEAQAEKDSKAKRVRLARFELPMIGDVIRR